MGEAIFAKYSKSSSGESVSNTTKAMLGLPNSASLDDCIKMLSLRGDSTHGTIQVTLKDIDGEPLGEHKIKMTDGDGKTLTYTTDGAGQCLFKTTAGTATFSEDGSVNAGWFDVNIAKPVTVDCPVGSVKTAEIQRYKKLSNGWGATITSNQWMNFSKFADKLNVSVRGGSGQGGSAGFNFWYISYNNKVSNLTLSFNDSSGTNYKFWTYGANCRTPGYIGVPGGSQSGSGPAINYGGWGANGSVSNGNNIDVSGKNFKIAIAGAMSSSYENHPFTIREKYMLHAIMDNCKAIGYNGSTGASSTAFGVTGSGGRGGEGGGRTSAMNGTNYGTGSMAGRGGTMLKGYAYATYTEKQLTSASIGVELQTGSSVAGQITISNFRYK